MQHEAIFKRVVESFQTWSPLIPSFPVHTLKSIHLLVESNSSSLNLLELWLVLTNEMRQKWCADSWSTLYKALLLSVAQAIHPVAKKLGLDYGMLRPSGRRDARWSSIEASDMRVRTLPNSQCSHLWVMRSRQLPWFIHWAQLPNRDLFELLNHRIRKTSKPLFLPPAKFGVDLLHSNRYGNSMIFPLLCPHFSDGVKHVEGNRELINK